MCLIRRVNINKLVAVSLTPLVIVKEIMLKKRMSAPLFHTKIHLVCDQWTAAFLSLFAAVCEGLTYKSAPWREDQNRNILGVCASVQMSVFFSRLPSIHKSLSVTSQLAGSAASKEFLCNFATPTPTPTPTKTPNLPLFYLLIVRNRSITIIKEASQKDTAYYTTL